MAKKNQLQSLRDRARRTATKELEGRDGFPIAPRKAMSQAKKASKNLPYPVAPFAGANPLQLYRWAQAEWQSLGRWQSLAAPVIIVVALLTWEKEKALQAARWFELEKADAKEKAARMYGAFGQPRSKRKLLGIIPLPGGK